MKSSPEQLWQTLATTRRESEAAGAEQDPQAEMAPLGFATRIVARWSALRRDAKFRYWSRWSLRAALAACTVLGLLALNRPTEKVLAAPASTEPAALAAPGIPLPFPAP